MVGAATASSAACWMVHLPVPFMPVLSSTCMGIRGGMGRAPGEADGCRQWLMVTGG